MIQNKNLEGNRYQGTNNELMPLQENVLTIQHLLKNTRDHLALHEVTPQLGKKTKWRERAMMLGAGLEFAITNFLESEHQMNLSNHFFQELASIERQTINFNEKLFISQSKVGLIDINNLADQFNKSSRKLIRYTNDLSKNSK